MPEKLPHLNLPSLTQAHELLEKAAGLNPGPWVEHSRHTAIAAHNIAARHPRLDPDDAYILGLLHDIGRRFGRTAMRHVLDGYLYLESLGYPDAARISLTHSFPIQNAMACAGAWDCTPEELAFVTYSLQQAIYTEYDHLIMICDSITLPGGFCLMEKRLVDVALRHGFNDWTIRKWKAYFSLKQQLEDEIGLSIYDVLPGVVENTFTIPVSQPDEEPGA